MSNLFPTSQRQSCDCPTDLREIHWLWSDCEEKGHGEGCFVVWCQFCDLYSSDCNETWRTIPEDWKK